MLRVSRPILAIPRRSIRFDSQSFRWADWDSSPASAILADASEPPPLTDVDILSGTLRVSRPILAIPRRSLRFDSQSFRWADWDSNPGHPACKADALTN